MIIGRSLNGHDRMMVWPLMNPLKVEANASSEYHSKRRRNRPEQIYVNKLIADVFCLEHGHINFIAESYAQNKVDKSSGRFYGNSCRHVQDDGRHRPLGQPNIKSFQIMMPKKNCVQTFH